MLLGRDGTKEIMMDLAKSLDMILASLMSLRSIRNSSKKLHNKKITDSPARPM
jgi:hypothetical protein